MIKFNSEHIMVGYIKNLLSTIKLPSMLKYEKDDYCINGQLYIKDDFVCRCEKSDNSIDFIKLFRFDEDYQENNYYTNLKFTGLNYDSHTHEYLGEYLRYLRDYKNINLMSLYNCFSNTFAENLRIYDASTSEVLIDQESDNYKYYMLPIKLNKNYTIAIDCNQTYEIFATLYGSYQYDSSDLNGLNSYLYRSTKKQINSSMFGSPFLYDKLTIENNSKLNSIYNSVANYYKDLKLIIKLPNNNKSSIVVLEGNYINNNNFGFRTYIEKSITESGYDNSYVDPFKIQYNYSVINFNAKEEQNKLKENNEDYLEYNPSDINLISNLQLLKINSSFSYPFADRLIEYLLNNAISSLETIPDNIKRVQTSLYNEWVNNPDTNWGRHNLASNYGIWTDDLKLNFYNLIKEKNLINTKSDLLGYVDKDVELNLGEYVDIYDEEDN